MVGTPSAPAVDSLVAEYEELQGKLADPAVHADQAASRKLGRRYAELTPIVATARELETTRGDLQVARELSDEDGAFVEEARGLAGRVDELEAKLAELLVPRDPDDKGSDAQRPDATPTSESWTFLTNHARVVREAEEHLRVVRQERPGLAGWVTSGLDIG